jgi:hypothetical protein
MKDRKDIRLARHSLHAARDTGTLLAPIMRGPHDKLMHFFKRVVIALHALLHLLARKYRHGWTQQMGQHQA